MTDGGQYLKHELLVTLEAAHHLIPTEKAVKIQYNPIDINLAAQINSRSGTKIIVLPRSHIPQKIRPDRVRELLRDFSSVGPASLVSSAVFTLFNFLLNILLNMEQLHKELTGCRARI